MPPFQQWETRGDCPRGERSPKRLTVDRGQEKAEPTIFRTHFLQAGQGSNRLR